LRCGFCFPKSPRRVGGVLNDLRLFLTLAPMDDGRQGKDSTSHPPLHFPRPPILVNPSTSLIPSHPTTSTDLLSPANHSTPTSPNDCVVLSPLPPPLPPQAGDKKSDTLLLGELTLSVSLFLSPACPSPRGQGGRMGGRGSRLVAMCRFFHPDRPHHPMPPCHPPRLASLPWPWPPCTAADGAVGAVDRQ
jgi:hypothetical protein